MRRSRSARCPSRLARRARRSASSRAARMAAVWRAYTSHVVTRKATSQTATQWRPLAIAGPVLPCHLEGPELRRAGPRVVAHLGGPGTDRLAREQAAQRAPAAGAHGLPWRADARPAPIAERVLDDAVLARVVGDHRHAAAGQERGAERRQRELELLELLVHDDPQRLEQSREGRPPPSPAARLANRVHEIVARSKWGRGTPPHDGPGQAARVWLVRGLRESVGQPRFGPA